MEYTDIFIAAKILELPGNETLAVNSNRESIRISDEEMSVINGLVYNTEGSQFVFAKYADDVKRTKSWHLLAVQHPEGHDEITSRGSDYKRLTGYSPVWYLEDI